MKNTSIAIVVIDNMVDMTSAARGTVAGTKNSSLSINFISAMIGIETSYRLENCITRSRTIITRVAHTAMYTIHIAPVPQLILLIS
jgi:hypothetical protein